MPSHGLSRQAERGLAPVVALAPAKAGPEPRRCVGPNAVIQLAAALREGFGEAVAERVFSQAGLAQSLIEPPAEMVDEAAVARLFRALFAALPAVQAERAAAEAGLRTARYLLANRIPGPARLALKTLPAPLAADFLLRAISRNAWTFAGSGQVRVHAGAPSVIEIQANPLAMPGCPWHIGVFEGLFRALVAPDASVYHPQCCFAGAAACRFEIGRAVDGGRQGGGGHGGG